MRPLDGVAVEELPIQRDDTGGRMIRHGLLTAMMMLIVPITNAGLVAAEAPLTSGEAKAVKTDSETAPRAEDVEKIIHELASVRDYERLYWILRASEQQVPPVRAELLKKLDDQIQKLFQAEVEVRTATAVAALQAIAPAGTGGAQAPTDASASIGEKKRAQTDASANATVASEPHQSYDAVKAHIEQAEFTGDIGKPDKQMMQLSRMILNVEDAQQRQQLRELMHERQLHVLRQKIAADRAAAAQRFSEPEEAAAGNSAEAENRQ